LKYPLVLNPPSPFRSGFGGKNKTDSTFDEGSLVMTGFSRVTRRVVEKLESSVIASLL